MIRPPEPNLEQGIDNLIESLDGRRPSGTTWPLLLAAVALVAVTSVWAADPNDLAAIDFKNIIDATAGALGAATLSSLFLAGLSWLVLYVVAVRRVNPRASGRYFFILLAVALLTQTAVLLVPYGGRAAAPGDVATMARFNEANQNAVMNDARSYREEMRATGINTIFSAPSLREDADLVRSRIKIREAQSIVEKYRAKARNRVDGLYGEVRRLPLSEAYKRHMIAAMSKSETRMRGEFERGWALEAATVQEYQNGLNILAEAKGRWAARPNGALVFARQADLVAWRASVGRLERLVAEQQAVQAGLQEMMKSRRN